MVLVLTCSAWLLVSLQLLAWVEPGLIVEAAKCSLWTLCGAVLALSLAA